MTEVTESFSYTPEELEEKYQSYEGAKDYFDYSYVRVAADTVETTNENGETAPLAPDETGPGAPIGRTRLMNYMIVRPYYVENEEQIPVLEDFIRSH